ncbi:MAG: DinB family protein, partial [Chloroflexota bacterium]
MWATRAKLIDDLKARQSEISALLDSVADQQDWRPDPAQWSFREIAAHLATVEEECFQERVARLAAGNAPHFEYYLNTGRDFSRLDLRESLRKWTATRREIIDFVQVLPEEKWTHVGAHETFGNINLLDAL